MRDQSVGAFFGSRLVHSTITNTIEEFARALEEDGIVVLQGVPVFTLKLLRKQGFEIKYFIKYSFSPIKQSQRAKVDLIAFKKGNINKNNNSSKKQS